MRNDTVSGPHVKQAHHYLVTPRTGSAVSTAAQGPTLPYRGVSAANSQPGSRLIRQTAGIEWSYRDFGLRQPHPRGTTDMLSAITDQTTYWEHWAERDADQPRGVSPQVWKVILLGSK